MIFDSIRVRLPSLLDNWTLKLLYGLLLPLSSLLANRCANRRLLFSSALLSSLRFEFAGGQCGREQRVPT